MPTLNRQTVVTAPATKGFDASKDEHEVASINEIELDYSSFNEIALPVNFSRLQRVHQELGLKKCLPTKTQERSRSKGENNAKQSKVTQRLLRLVLSAPICLIVNQKCP